MRLRCSMLACLRMSWLLAVVTMRLSCSGHTPANQESRHVRRCRHRCHVKGCPLMREPPACPTAPALAPGFFLDPIWTQTPQHSAKHGDTRQSRGSQKSLKNLTERHPTTHHATTILETWQRRSLCFSPDCPDTADKQ